MMALLFLSRKEESVVKGLDNKYSTNKGGVIQSPKPVTKDEPKSTVTKGSDLRNGKGK